MSDSWWPHGLQHARPPCPSPTPEFTQTHVHWSRWCHPVISSCRPLLLLPSIFPSIRVFSNGSALHIRWPNYWSFRFNISPCNEHPGLIFFRMDWLDLLAVQGTLKSFLQHHKFKSINSSVLFIAQLSHPYMTTGKRRKLEAYKYSLCSHFDGEGNGSPLQCSCLENPGNSGAWWAAVCGVTQSRTRLKRLSSSSSSSCFGIALHEKSWNY